MEKAVDVVIVGGGPAGLTAALYASRANLSTIVLERGKLGGQIALTHEIANFPGAVYGSEEEPSGTELIDRMAEQAEKFGAEILTKKIVTKIEPDGDKKKVICKDGSEYIAKAVIVTTGAIPRGIGCEGEAALKGKGVSYCATCDGHFFEDFEVYVVGGGNSAVEEAMFLTNFARKVTIIQKLPYLTAAPIAIEQAKKNDKIDYIFNSEVVKIEGDGMVESITIRNDETGELTKIDADEEDGTFGLFIFIGFIPQNELLKDLVEMDEYGYILTDDSMATSVPGIFAAGDLRPKTLRQVITAAGDGATAAVAAQKYIEKQE